MKKPLAISKKHDIIHLDCDDYLRLSIEKNYFQIIIKKTRRSNYTQTDNNEKGVINKYLFKNMKKDSSSDLENSLIITSFQNEYLNGKSLVEEKVKTKSYMMNNSILKYKLITKSSEENYLEFKNSRLSTRCKRVYFKIEKVKRRKLPFFKIIRDSERMKGKVFKRNPISFRFNIVNNKTRNIKAMLFSKKN